MILGIDPGTENIGFGVVDGEKLVDCGILKLENKKNNLDEVYNELEKLIKKYPIKEMVVESLFFAKNAKSAIKVAESIGAIKVCGLKNKLLVKEYTPLQVKMALTGYGRAEKEQVEEMVRSCLNLSEVIRPSHAADAVAVALTHGFTMRI